MANRSYALMTAAKNEASLIKYPLDSVVRQTILPIKWIIVSDSSTDTTDQVVASYQRQYDFIELYRLNHADGRNFAAKARAIESAYQRIKHLDFGYIGNLDADVGLDPTYYEQILRRFESDPRLGIAGGKKHELRNGVLVRLPSARNSVGGPFQLFRRRCWEESGGYPSVRFGGEDSIAEITARMKGWRVESFLDLAVRHYRETGTATHRRLAARFRDGRKLHALGYHPLFFAARTMYRAFQPPWLLGALSTSLGYLYAGMSGEPRDVPRELVAFLRDEQLRRLRLRRARRAS